MASSITITFNRFPEIAAKLPKETSAVVRKTAFDVEARAKMVVPVDTGALKNSITTEMQGDMTAIVAPHTEYAVFVEYGTSRGSPAQPYMTPAAEAMQAPFERAMTQLLNRL
jgi:HK97 gp10 family phage protein